MKNYHEPQLTLETELHAIGYLQEIMRRNGISIHADQVLVKRKVQAINWAAVAKMARHTFNFFIMEGEKEARLGKLKYESGYEEIENAYTNHDYKNEVAL